MSRIRVNPIELRNVAHEIEEVAQGYLSLAERALRATQDAPSYNSQFGPKVRVIGYDARARLNVHANRLSELSQELAQLAEAFERADMEAVIGLKGLGLSVQALVEASLGNPLLGLFLGQIRPPNISAERWAMLPIEDRLAIFGSLQGSLAFIVGASTVEGVELYVLNPLRIRRDPGMGGDVLAYAEPGSTVTWTGEDQEINGTTWYAVTYVHPIMGLVTGWASNKYLKDGEYRVGYGPETVAQNFTIQENREVMEGGGSLMAVNSDWLVILDGPTWEYGKAVDPVEWGGVVRWTGKYIEEGGHTWYEVTCWKEGEDGNLEPAIGWTRGDRVADYEPRADAPPPVEGKIWVPLQQERSFSHYNLFDVDDYVPTSNEFAANVQIPWKYDIRPEGIDTTIEVPYGSLYGPDGVAMQGSGKVTVEVVNKVTGETHQHTVYFTLDNPRDLDWNNATGDLTEWGEHGWTNGQPAEIANPEVAQFRPYSRVSELTSEVSLAGPPEYRGQRIWAPDLQGSLANNPDAVFTVEDAGGTFPHGSRRFDLYIEDAQEGLDWYGRANRLKIPVYVEQEIPPVLESFSNT
jgi:hypothetical protein